MKIKILFSICALLIVSLATSFADDVKFSMMRKKLSQSSTRDAGGHGVTNQTVESADIIYVVTVESTSFKDLSNITIEYNIYYEEAQFGSAGKPTIKTLTGKYMIEKLLSRKIEKFDTDAITIKDQRLDGNWSFTSGASNTAKDRVVGNVIKAFDAEGKSLGQYLWPTIVSTKFEWKKP